MPDNEYDFDIITVIDDDGVEHEFEEIDRIETEDSKYVALLSIFENAQEIIDNDGDVIILKVIEGSDGETYLAEIEDEEEFADISDIFQERINEMFEYDESEGQ